MPRYVPASSQESPRFTEPPTFARLSWVQHLQDLDLAVVGVPFDTGVTCRMGGRFGPDAVRGASAMPRRCNPRLEIAAHVETLDLVPVGRMQPPLDARPAEVRVSGRHTTEDPTWT